MSVRCSEVTISLGFGGNNPGWTADNSVREFAARSEGVLFHHHELEALIRFHERAIQYLQRRRFGLDELSESAQNTRPCLKLSCV